MGWNDRQSPMLVGARSTSSFDVICAGEALWDVGALGEGGRSRPSLRLRPSGGAVNAAVALARSGLRVGLAATIADDAMGRSLLEKVAAAGVDTSGVTLAAPRAQQLVVASAAGAAHRLVGLRTEEQQAVTVPEGWTAAVLLLSGLSPALAHAASFCKAARAARRAGTMVVVDVNARRHTWAGWDPRTIRALLHEADVVRCSTDDLTALGIDESRLRAAMRPSAAIVVTQGPGAARASGPFGEIARAPQVTVAKHAAGAGDAFTAALCAELARGGDHAASLPEVWDRALSRGHAAAGARMARAE
jgi:sugar/nucleoside kinase (ribokinase family)